MIKREENNYEIPMSVLDFGILSLAQLKLLAETSVGISVGIGTHVEIIRL
ncbi:hypothetical protein GCM10007161_14800 [Ignatzschineria indica]|nr:hypothetical protein GCM10007161_14800 [Ignatzschineria indica]